MKFTTILATALPLLAAASALPNAPVEGGWPGNWAEDHEGWAGEGPPGSVGSNIPANQGDLPHGQYQGQHQPRALDARADSDIMVEECTYERTECKRQVVIPKGETKGKCVNSLYPNTFDATIDLVSDHIVCTYWNDFACQSSYERHPIGPWSTADKEYSSTTFWNNWFGYRPKSYKCDVITFATVRAPLEKYRNL